MPSRGGGGPPKRPPGDRFASGPPPKKRKKKRSKKKQSNRNYRNYKDREEKIIKEAARSNIVTDFSERISTLVLVVRKKSVTVKQEPKDFEISADSRESSDEELRLLYDAPL